MYHIHLLHIYNYNFLSNKIYINMTNLNNACEQEVTNNFPLGQVNTNTLILVNLASSCKTAKNCLILSLMKF